MKVLKITATVLLGVALFAALLALQAGLLARCTVLDPDYYGAPQRQVYEVLSDYAVRVFTDMVQDNAPPEALRTTDRQAAYQLARAALPDAQSVQMLQDAAPNIVRYMLDGGAPPLLGDPDALNHSGLDMLGAVLKDGALLFIPAAQRPRLTDYLPFTPAWNAQNAAGIDGWAAPLRMLWAQRNGILWIAAGVVVFLMGFLYALWMRSPRPFYVLCGWVLLSQCALWLALALGLRLFHSQLLDGVLTHPMQALFLPSFVGALPDLTTAALGPFTAALAMAGAIVFSFSLVCFAMATERSVPVATDIPVPCDLGARESEPQTEPAQ